MTFLNFLINVLIYKGVPSTTNSDLNTSAFCRRVQLTHNLSLYVQVYHFYQPPH